MARFLWLTVYILYFAMHDAAILKHIKAEKHKHTKTDTLCKSKRTKGRKKTLQNQIANKCFYHNSEHIVMIFLNIRLGVCVCCAVFIDRNDGDHL